MIAYYAVGKTAKDIRTRLGLSERQFMKMREEAQRILGGVSVGGVLVEAISGDFELLDTLEALGLKSELDQLMVCENTLHTLLHEDGLPKTEIAVLAELANGKVEMSSPLRRAKVSLWLKEELGRETPAGMVIAAATLARLLGPRRAA